MNQTKYKSFVLIAVLVVADFVFLAAWLYLYFSVDSKIMLIEEMQMEVKTKERQLESRHDTKKLVESLSEQKKKIDDVFLSPDNLVNLVEQIEEIGRSAGVVANINSVDNFGSVKNRPSFKISASGDYNKIFKFLILLENLPTKMMIKSTSWGGQSSAPDIMAAPWSANFDIILLSYEAEG